MTTENPSVQSYVLEARELLGQLELMLLDLENGASAEAVDSVVRALHTLKGGGAMFGFPALSAFVHHFEDAFDLVREGRIGVSAALLDAALAGRDHMITLLDLDGDSAATAALQASPEAAALLAALRAAVDNAPAARAPREAEWDIRFRPTPTALRHGMRPDLLIEELAGLGPCQVTCDASDLPALAEMDPTLCHPDWTSRLTTAQPRAAIEAVFIFAEDADLSITPAGPAAMAIIDGVLVRLGEDVFVIPLISVEECAEFDLAELARDSGRSMLRIRDHMVPFVDLADALEGETRNDGRRRVVIVRAEGERMGLVVDDILGQHQTVIKPMNAFHAGLQDFAGATNLADGSVALILDTEALFRPDADLPTEP